MFSILSLLIFPISDVSWMGEQREVPTSERRHRITGKRIRELRADSGSYLVHKIILWDKTVSHWSWEGFSPLQAAHQFNQYLLTAGCVLKNLF